MTTIIVICFIMFQVHTDLLLLYIGPPIIPLNQSTAFPWTTAIIGKRTNGINAIGLFIINSETSMSRLDIPLCTVHVVGCRWNPLYRKSS